jgi:hypothetical protein
MRRRLVVEQQRIDHMAQLHREGIHNIGVLVDVFLSDAHLQNALYKDPADRSVFVRGLLVVNAGQPAPVLNPVKFASDCVAQFYTGDVFNQLPFNGGRVHKCMLALVRTLCGLECRRRAGVQPRWPDRQPTAHFFGRADIRKAPRHRPRDGARQSRGCGFWAAQDGRGIRRAHHQSGTVKFLRPSAAKYFPKYKLPPKKPYFLQNIFIFSKYILWQPCCAQDQDPRDPVPVPLPCPDCRRALFLNTDALKRKRRVFFVPLLCARSAVPTHG